MVKKTHGGGDVYNGDDDSDDDNHDGDNSNEDNDNKDAAADNDDGKIQVFEYISPPPPTQFN